MRTARVQSVMNAYNELDGIPCAADSMLLTTILRDEWGFEGCVVSDYFSIKQLVDYHRFAVDAQDAAVQALAAGMDVELPSSDCYDEPLLDAVRSDLVSTEIARPRRAPRAADEVRPRPLRAAVRRHVDGSPDERQRRAARASRARSRARASCSCATTAPCRSSRRSARSRSSARAPTTCATCSATTRIPRTSSRSATCSRPAREQSRRRSSAGSTSAAARSSRRRFSTRSASTSASACATSAAARSTGTARDGFDAAVALARDADVAVMVMGDKSGLTSDCTSGESNDCSSLDLPGVQDELIAAVAATGTPIVLVLVAGRPYGATPAARGVRGRAPGVASGRGRRGGDRRDPGRRGESRRQAADLLSALGRTDPGLLRAQDLRRPLALEGRLRRRSRDAALSVRPRAELHELRARRRGGPARRPSRGPRRSPSTSPSRTPATVPATRSCSSTSATRRRASRVRCSS